MTRRAGAALIGLIAVLLAVVPGAAPAWAGPLARTMPAQPGQPTGLTATVVSNSEIDLSWTAPSGDPPAVSYNVWYGTAAGAEDTQANSDPIQGTTYQVTGLACQTYYFVVDAVDADSNVSSDSGEAQGTTCLPTSSGGSSAPLAPTGLTATAVSSSEIDLSWTQPRGYPPPVGYNVYDGTGQGQEGNNPVDAQLVPGTTDKVMNLNSGTTYYFVVVAVDANGDPSDDSTEANATTRPAVVTTTAAAVPPTAPSGGSSGSSGGQLWIILPLLFGVGAVGGLIAWRRRRKRRRPVPQDAPAPQAAPPASSLHAVARPGSPGVVVVRPTGTEPTLTVRIEPHRAPSITTIEEVPPR